MRTKYSIVMLTLVLATAGVALGDEKQDRARTGPDLAPVTNSLHAKECSACHFAYPPGLLPARSWQKLMANLSDHFGENAELAPDDAKALTEYLVNNAADKQPSGRSYRIAQSIPANQTPLRITEAPYIVREHREIPAHMVKGNPQVKSLSRCDACHTRAEEGSFEEREVKIPGYGAWED
jgi:cytochrome c5